MANQMVQATTNGINIRTPLPGPNARRLIAEDTLFMSPSYTRSYPLVAKRGAGVMVEDVDGNQFLDFAAGIAVCSTGHCHPQVVSAIQKQAAELIHISGTDFYYEQMTALAARLSAVAPMRGPHKFFYGNSGAEAVECALKLARYHTRRSKIVAFQGGFHGRTMGALSLTASKAQQRRRFSPLVPEVTHVPYPYAYRNCPGEPAEQAEFAFRCARYIEETLFRTMAPAEEVAAIVLEPIQGEGGYVVAPDNFLHEIRRICDEHGILMVLDEVQSGCGRTGKWWAIQHSGVEPDIVTIAKGIASGMPLGICMAKADIMDWVPGSHASTFGGNPVCIAAALATLDVLEAGAIKNAEQVGNFILNRAAGWTKTHPMVGDVRGRGLMIGIEIVRDKTLRTVAGPERDRIVELAFARGVLLLGCGENTLRLAPPLIVSREQAAVALDILEECIRLVEATTPEQVRSTDEPGVPAGT